MNRVALQPCTGYANIGIDFHYDENKWVKKPNRFPRILIGKRVGKMDVVYRMNLPHYDMSQVKRSTARFLVEDFDQSVYDMCMEDALGKQLYYEMRNDKANSIVIQSIEHCKDLYAPTVTRLAKGEIGPLIDFYKHLLKTPRLVELDKNAVVEGEIPNPAGFQDPVLNITKEEIWNKFKAAGLVKLMQTRKKQKS